MRRSASLRNTVLTVALATTMLTALASAASAHSCVSNWCSGSDSSSSTNVQGNDPQLYGGEVGTVDDDFGGFTGPCGVTTGNPDGACFSVAGANGAKDRANAGTGLGIVFYYPVNGAASSYRGSRSYCCWGWAQAKKAMTDSVSNQFANYTFWTWILFADIEPGDSSWDTSHDNNRQVFNGFSDYLARRTSADTGCSGSGQLQYQYGIYSTPIRFNSAFGSTGAAQHMPNTVEWTAVPDGPDTWPGAYPGVITDNAQFWDDSSYENDWQFHGGFNTPDHDIFYEPIYLYVFGSDWGT